MKNKEESVQMTDETGGETTWMDNVLHKTCWRERSFRNALRNSPTVKIEDNPRIAPAQFHGPFHFGII